MATTGEGATWQAAGKGSRCLRGLQDKKQQKNKGRTNRKELILKIVTNLEHLEVGRATPEGGTSDSSWTDRGN